MQWRTPPFMCCPYIRWYSWDAEWQRHGRRSMQRRICRTCNGQCSSRLQPNSCRCITLPMCAGYDLGMSMCHCHGQAGTCSSRLGWGGRSAVMIARKRLVPGNRHCRGWWTASLPLLDWAVACWTSSRWLLPAPCAVHPVQPRGGDGPAPAPCTHGTCTAYAVYMKLCVSCSLSVTSIPEGRESPSLPVFTDKSLQCCQEGSR